MRADRVTQRQESRQRACFLNFYFALLRESKAAKPGVPIGGCKQCKVFGQVNVCYLPTSRSRTHLQGRSLQLCKSIPPIIPRWRRRRQLAGRICVHLHGWRAVIPVFTSPAFSLSRWLLISRLLLIWGRVHPGRRSNYTVSCSRLLATPPREEDRQNDDQCT